ncbi:MAG: TolC family protein [Candidatus Hydrogenedentes bacterium]|nr:TolC family protein [Candidatus Hydrogenedentota bacterium]
MFRLLAGLLLACGTAAAQVQGAEGGANPGAGSQPEILEAAPATSVQDIVESGPDTSVADIVQDEPVTSVQDVVNETAAPDATAATQGIPEAAATPDAAAPQEPGDAEAGSAQTPPNPGAGLAPAELSLQYDMMFSGEVDNEIQRQISVDLIDLNKLREALEPQMSRDVIRVSLQECSLIALQENQDIQVAEYEPLKAYADFLAAKGEFDPVAATDITYLYAASSLSQQEVAFGGISSVETWRTDTNSTLSGKLHYGTLYQVNFAMGKEETTFGKFIEEWEGMLTLTLTQPLLRGAGKLVNTARIRAAENAQGIAAAQLQLQVMQTMAEVVKAYWDLVGAIEALKVRQESLGNAERLLNIQETRREIGTAADIEVLSAKAGVAARQSDVISARTLVGDAEDRLKTLLNVHDGAYFSKARIVPIDRPDHLASPLIEEVNFEALRDEAVDKALEQRPEILMAELEISNAELEEKRARNEMLPQIDVTASIGQGGRDHKPRQVFYGIRAGEDNVETYGLQGSIPLGNRAARGQHLRARLTREQSEQRFEQTRQQIMANVHIAVRNVLKNSVLVETNRQTVNMSSAEATAEEKRLRLGVSTSYTVLQKQEDLTAAQVQELQARISYEQSLIDLQLAEGSLLESLGVEYEAPADPRPVGYFDSITPW